MPNKKYIDEHLLVHSVRIYLTNGKQLYYIIDAPRKTVLEEWLLQRTQSYSENVKHFLSFYTVSDRMVFIKIAAIKRLVIGWDANVDFDDAAEYQDNFDVNEPSDIEERKGEMLPIPDMIILLNGDEKPLLFDNLDADDDCLGFDEDSINEENFITSGFISLPDVDGEQNYIPVINIECMEMSRSFLYPDDIWQDMENERRLDDNKN